MVNNQILDALAVLAGFKHTRREALRLGCCAACGRDVNPAVLADDDQREYLISGICPACFADFEAANRD